MSNDFLRFLSLSKNNDSEDANAINDDKMKLKSFSEVYAFSGDPTDFYSMSKFPKENDITAPTPNTGREKWPTIICDHCQSTKEPKEHETDLRLCKDCKEWCVPIICQDCCAELHQSNCCG